MRPDETLATLSTAKNNPLFKIIMYCIQYIITDKMQYTLVIMRAYAKERKPATENLVVQSDIKYSV